VTDSKVPNPYTDPTTGEWVGEYETRSQDGEVNRKTEWFPTEQEARNFARTGKLPTTDSEHGFVCKKCGKPSPVGVGYVAPGKEAAEASAGITACECGHSMAVDKDGYVILTPALAKAARETTDDVATPAGSLGVIDRCGERYAYVNVSNPMADDVGTHRYEIGQLSVNPKSVAYWRQQGYID
jgi:hypothetical protein